MVIIVKTRVELWKQIWSWPVVGVVVPLVLGGGIAFMTSSHPWLGDVFYLAGGILFIVKFLTWEDARQLDTVKRRNSYGLAYLGGKLLVRWVNLRSRSTLCFLQRGSKEKFQLKACASQPFATAAHFRL